MSLHPPNCRLPLPLPTQPHLQLLASLAVFSLELRRTEMARHPRLVPGLMLNMYFRYLLRTWFRCLWNYEQRL